jgi:hypothetical protein
VKTEEEIKERIDQIVVFPPKTDILNMYWCGYIKALEWVLED